MGWKTKVSEALSRRRRIIPEIDFLGSWELATNQSASIRNLSKREFKTWALQHYFFNEAIILRQLFPKDIGLKDWEYYSNSEYYSWVDNYNTSSRQCLMIYKITKFGENNCSGEQITFLIDGIVKSTFDLTKLDILPELLKKIASKANINTWLDWIKEVGLDGYMLTAIFIPPDSTLDIRILSKTQGRSKLILGGYVIEPDGATINIGV